LPRHALDEGKMNSNNLLPLELHNGVSLKGRIKRVTMTMNVKVCMSRKGERSEEKREEKEKEKHDSMKRAQSQT
jgi:hypothetical protein